MPIGQLGTGILDPSDGQLPRREAAPPAWTFKGLTAPAISAGVRTQSALRTETQRLASGLRINTAADDPSGLAIAESLASKVAGLDQGVHEIQNAGNALNVAEGAMASISDILQRMRALVVQARSDLQSTADRNDMQAELSQLRLEIDKIAQNTTFNGRALLDGSASSAIPQPPRVIIPKNDGLAGGGTGDRHDRRPVDAQPRAHRAADRAAPDHRLVRSGRERAEHHGDDRQPRGGVRPEQVATAQVGAGTNYPLGGSRAHRPA